MGKKSQRKDRGGELGLSKIFQKYGYYVKPGGPLNYGKEPDVVDLKRMHPKVKRTEQVYLTDWIAQVVRDV